MDQIEYSRLPPMGSEPTRVRAALHEFLLDIPGLFYLGYIPPLQVVNEFLKTGRADAGMSGGSEWEPFVISPDAYAEVLRVLGESGFHQSGRELRLVEVPESIRNKNEWAAWVMHQEVGIPFEEHLELLDQEEELQRRAREAAERGDEDAEELHLEWYGVATKLVELGEPYMARYRERRGN